MGTGDREELPPTPSPVSLELRIHGVHGTSPASMLGVPPADVVQVAGDSVTGFYRSSSGELPYRELPEGMAVEAYSWGALTSGARGLFGWVQRALWLLLLPFALANLSYWARLELGRSGWQARWGASAVRVAALVLTLFYVVIASTIFVDFVGWQCYRGGSPACPGIPSWFDWLGARSVGVRLAVGSLGPVLLVMLFMLLTNKSLARYEAVADPMRKGLDPDRRSGSRERDDRAEGGILVDPLLWQGAGRTRLLRDAHLVAALAVIVLFVDLHVLAVWRPGPGHAGVHHGFQVAVWGAAVLLALAVLLVACTLPGDVERQLWGPERWRSVDLLRRGQSVVGWGVRIAWLWGIANLVLLLLSPPDAYDELSDFYGRNYWFVVLFLILTTLHLCIFAGGRLPGILSAIVPLGLGIVLVLDFLYIARPWSGTGSLVDDRTRVLVGIAVAVGAFGTLAGWHYLLSWRVRRAAESAPPTYLDERHRSLPRAAYAGAGSSVLLASAAWIALLFATGAVVGSANLLNGSAPLTALATRLPDAERPVGDTAAANAADRGQLKVRLTISGEADAERPLSSTLRVEDAVYAEISDRLVLFSGTLHAAAAWRGNPFSAGTPLRVVQQGGPLDFWNIRLPFETRHDVAQDSVVTMLNSCSLGSFRTTSRGLFAEAARYVCRNDGSGRFRAVREVKVASHRLQVNAPASPVELVLDKPGYTPLVVPQVLSWAPVLQLVWLLLVAVLVGGCLVLFRTTAGRRVRRRHRYVGVPEPDLAGAQEARVAAAFAHRAERLLDLVGAVTAPVGLVLIAISGLHRALWEIAPSDSFLKIVSDLSLYVVAGFAAAMVLVGSRIRTSESTRKAVGVIWDLATFWPRAAHPLAPPCYAERIVPEITARVRWAQEVSPDRLVVLSGHSQGSLVVATVAARLPSLDRIRVVTYGSQIRALYGRFFPRVFGPDVVGYEPTTGAARLHDAVPDVPPCPKGHVDDVVHEVSPVADPPPDSIRGRLPVGGWVNLFRRTDPLGWRVFSDHDSEIDVASLEVPVADMGDPGPPVQGHSSYQHTPEYRRVVRRWTHEPYVDPPSSTTTVDPLPAP